jgi:hypothetical protein
MTTRVARILVGAFVMAVASQALAQQPATTRIKGTVEKLDGNLLTVKGPDGSQSNVTLTDKLLVVGVVQASLADIKEGAYVGSAAMPQLDGTQKALEVHIFAESQRGTGEGHRPYSLPNSTMTNGTVGATVTGNDGHVLTVKYKEGEKKIVVPPGTPIVRYEIGDKSELTPGAQVTLLNVAKQPDGSLQGARVNVGRGGVVPQ